MSQKAVIKPYQVMKDGDMSQEIYTSVTDIESLDNVAYQVSWTGSPEGDFGLFGSLNGDLWERLTVSPEMKAEGEPGSFLINMRSIPYPLVQLGYKPTAGSGVLNVWASAKRLGG